MEVILLVPSPMTGLVCRPSINGLLSTKELLFFFSETDNRGVGGRGQPSTRANLRISIVNLLRRITMNDLPKISTQVSSPQPLDYPRQKRW